MNQPVRLHPTGRLHGAAVVLVAISLFIAAPVVLGAGASIVDALGEDWSTEIGAPRAVHDGLFVVRSAGYPLIVGLLATLIGWPVAMLLASGGRARMWGAVLAAVPMLLPSYLSFAGWRMARGPGTWLGDRLAVAPEWWVSAIDRGLALVGIALWAWPMAALVLAIGLSQVGGGVIDQLRVDGAGRIARGWHLIRMVRGTIVIAILSVVLLTLGSAVPMHLAQMDTLAQRLWVQLQLLPMGRVWVESWPLVLVGIVSAWVVTKRVTSAADESPLSAGMCVTRTAVIATGGALAASVVGPMVVMALAMRRSSSIMAFWTETGDAVVSSAGVAGVVGVVVSALGGATWWLVAARRQNWLARWALGVSVVLAVIPGVLIGAALRRAMGVPGLGWLLEALPAAAGLVIAHSARFGVVGVLVGWWLARSESRDAADSRVMDSATGFRGWWRACVSARGGALVGVALGAAALSLYEIEASVVVQPPGSASLAQRVLELLHYNRDEQLCAAAVNMLGIGIVLATLAGWLWARAARPALPTD